MAVKRLANEAVLGEAPEDLCFTLGDFDPVVKFLAPTIGGCPSEQAKREGPGAWLCRAPDQGPLRGANSIRWETVCNTVY